VSALCHLPKFRFLTIKHPSDQQLVEGFSAWQSSLGLPSSRVDRLATGRSETAPVSRLGWGL